MMIKEIEDKFAGSHDSELNKAERAKFEKEQ